MSCHDIGRGLNSVSRVLDGLYGEGRIGKEETLILMRAIAKGVHWCDGNEHEALAWFYQKRCARCLKVIEEDTDAFDLWRCKAPSGPYHGLGTARAEQRPQEPDPIGLDDDQLRAIKKKLPYLQVCEDCLESILRDAGVDAAGISALKEKARGEEGSRKWAREFNYFMFEWHRS